MTVMDENKLNNCDRMLMDIVFRNCMSYIYFVKTFRVISLHVMVILRHIQTLCRQISFLKVKQRHSQASILVFSV